MMNTKIFLVVVGLMVPGDAAPATDADASWWSGRRGALADSNHDFSWPTSCVATSTEPTDVRKLFALALAAGGNQSKCTLAGSELLRYLRAVGGADESTATALNNPHPSSWESGTPFLVRASEAYASAVVKILDADNDGELGLAEMAAALPGSAREVSACSRSLGYPNCFRLFP